MMWQSMGRETPASDAGREREPLTRRSTGLRIKDLAIAMLPLGIWVTGAVAYERIAPPLVEATLAPARLAVAMPLPSLRDERSLLDTISPATSAAAASAAPTAPDTAIRLAMSRELTLTAGTESRLPLGPDPAAGIPKGAYLVVRGVPQDATLSHGVPIGPEIWLIDGTDIERVSIKMSAGLPARRELVLQLVSVDGRLLAEDRLLVEAQSIKMPDAPMPVSAPALAALDSPAVAPMVILPRAADEPTQPDLALPAAAAVAQAPARDKPVQTASAPHSSSIPTLPETTKPTKSAAPAVPSTPKKSPVTADAKAVEAALARGNRMLEMGNVAIARPLLERAANGGSVVAALLMASSFDPNWLKRSGAVGVVADAAQARHWYGEARRLGSTEAERLAAALPSK